MAAKPNRTSLQRSTNTDNMQMLKGLRILVVEDVGMVAMSLKAMLQDLGCMAVGTAARLHEAQRTTLLPNGKGVKRIEMKPGRLPRGQDLCVVSDRSTDGRLWMIEGELVPRPFLLDRSNGRRKRVRHFPGEDVTVCDMCLVGGIGVW